MGVPPVELLKLPLSLCNASRRVSTNVSPATAAFGPPLPFQNIRFRIPITPRVTSRVTSRVAVRATVFSAFSAVD